MKAIAPALLYALFVWWFSTGLVLLLVLRRGAPKVSLAVATVLFPTCLIVLAATSTMPGVFGAYAAFTAAIGIWGTQEIAFLTGFLTGPRPAPCPPGAAGMARLRAALDAILYHEIALLVTGAAVVAVTWRETNQVGALTFAVLWVMRISAKLNLFLGVPVLNDEVLPERLSWIRSYFRRGPVNDLFPLTFLGGVLIGCLLAVEAADPDATVATQVGNVLVASLMGLAILEHVFMVVPLPIDRLWRWSTGRRGRRRAASERARTTGADLGRESVVPTQP